MSHSVSTKTLRLLASISTERITSSFEALIELARLNRVLLGFLRVIDYDGPLRAVEEAHYRSFLESVASVCEALNYVRYALFKYRRPVIRVSVDIDILVDTGDVGVAVSRLRSLGFNVIVSEPYTVTLQRNNVIIDLYTYPSFAWAVYIDGGRLLDGYVEDVNVLEVPCRAITRGAEAVVAVAHAIYKEHVYLLSDFFVTREWLDREALNLASELGVEGATLYSLELNRAIVRGEIETPYKIPLPRLAQLYAELFKENSMFRATALNIVRSLMTRRSGRLIYSRLTRKSY